MGGVQHNDNPMNVPQPAGEPYSTGDMVVVYLSESDVDAQYHGQTCVVTERHGDQFNEETGRELDAYYYRVEHVDSGEEIPVDFRHFDLVPADEIGESESIHSDSTNM